MILKHLLLSRLRRRPGSARPLAHLRTASLFVPCHVSRGVNGVGGENATAVFSWRLKALSHRRLIKGRGIIVNEGQSGSDPVLLMADHRFFVWKTWRSYTLQRERRRGRKAKMVARAGGEGSKKRGRQRNKPDRGRRRREGRKRWRGGRVKVRFKLALGELLPWKCFED